MDLLSTILWRYGVNTIFESLPTCGQTELSASSTRVDGAGKLSNNLLIAM